MKSVKQETVLLGARWLAIAILLSVTPLATAHTLINGGPLKEGEQKTLELHINHGCGGENGGGTVIGTSVVVPDTAGGNVITVDGQPFDDPDGLGADAFLDGGVPQVQLPFDRASFDLMGAKKDPDLGNTVGFWAGGGPGVHPSLKGIVRFIPGGAFFNPESCAKKVTLRYPVIDVCQVTTVTGFTNDTVQRWTPKDIGTPYDTDLEHDATTARVTYVRDLEINPLPADCGTDRPIQEEVVITPTAAQITRDMPVKIDGQQIWPLP